MSYFIIYGTEDGTIIKEFPNQFETTKYLDNYFSDTPVYFLNNAPIHIEELYHVNKVMVIKGELITPKAVTIIKSFEVE